MPGIVGNLLRPTLFTEPTLAEPDGPVDHDGWTIGGQGTRTRRTQLGPINPGKASLGNNSLPKRLENAHPTWIYSIKGGHLGFRFFTPSPSGLLKHWHYIHEMATKSRPE